MIAAEGTPSKCANAVFLQMPGQIARIFSFSRRATAIRPWPGSVGGQRADLRSACGVQDFVAISTNGRLVDGRMPEVKSKLA
jgi:hypothetical protein